KQADGSWSKPVNLGEPFNSSADDIYFRMNEKDNDRIFFSSSRPGGYGNMDIYTFEENVEPIFGNCTAEENKKYIEIMGADTMELNDQARFVANAKEKGFTRFFWKAGGIEAVEAPALKHSFAKTGWNTLELEAYGKHKEIDDYRFCVSKKVFVYSKRERDSLLAARKKIEEEMLALDKKNNENNTVNNNASNNKNTKTKPGLPVRVEMEELEKVDVGLTLSTIYFDFDKQDINADAAAQLQANLKLLRENTDVYITISGHTDSKGSSAYNKRLAERRAKATRAFLISNGVDASRIVAVASEGEERPAAANELNDGSDSPEGRAKNRRVEFAVYRKKATS
ncbi:MAG TPA: OmpA family protein, partial [Flavobacteriales bacterium]|nr:OmpA family protein [Flavobacteriales bacterium]